MNSFIALRAQPIDALKHLAIQVLSQGDHILIDAHKLALAALFVDVRNDIERKVEDALKVTGREVQQETDAARRTLEVPYVANG
jgi:hypothetical protein